jgi:hypothetical protein
MDSNDTSLVVVNGSTGAGYYWTSPTFAQITDADFLSAGDVEFVDNYLLFRKLNSGVFFGADLGSPSSFDALNFATAEGHPDNLVGMKVDHRQVILFGEKTVELWENTGVSGFPFERMINGFVEIGCQNGRTIAKLDNSVMWVANDFTVRRLDGITPVRISTHAIEQWLRTVTMSSGQAQTWSFEGHTFYGLTFTEGTKVYDVATGMWHDRSSYQEVNWKWGFATEFDGKVLVADTTSNTIGYFSATTYDELGALQRMEWVYQPVYAEGRRAFHDKLEIGMETGVGLTTGQGSAPEIMLDVSDDGAATWRSLPNKSIGAIGKRNTRVLWSSLGSARQRVYRGAISDPVKVTITDTQLQVRGGRL